MNQTQETLVIGVILLGALGFLTRRLFNFLRSATSSRGKICGKCGCAKVGGPDGTN